MLTHRRISAAHGLPQHPSQPSQTDALLAFEKGGKFHLPVISRLSADLVSLADNSGVAIQFKSSTDSCSISEPPQWQQLGNCTEGALLMNLPL